ncbi:hypothetical protein RUND412_003370 [Rhizina undulata]
MVSIRVPETKEQRGTYAPAGGSSRRYTPSRLARRFFPLVLVAFVVLECYRFLYAFPAAPLVPQHRKTEAVRAKWDVEPVVDPQWGDVGQGIYRMELKNLVVVGCHAIWIGGETKGEVDDEWKFHGDFQKGEPPTYIRHIEEGIKAAAADPDSLLIFSGGETISRAGPRSEALSYYEVAAARSLLSSSLRNRTTTETFALDSYQNLLFSICRFHEITSTYPASITLISHGFKQYRFEQLHRKALRYPSENFHFVGINVPGYYADADVKEKIERGEEKTVKEWHGDLFGCSMNGSDLRRKRLGRNWGRRVHPYTKTCPEMAALLEWCGGDETDSFPGSLPWLEG